MVNGLIGKRYNKMTIVNYARTDSNYQKYFLCKCDCGNTKECRLSSLKYGSTKSCGCIQVEHAKGLAKRVLTKHGHASHSDRSRTYRIWISMKGRVKKNYTESKYYYERGIKVCERWKYFVNFLEDMGECPNDNYSIDRIDVNGDYEPSNCRWATSVEQNYNKRNTPILKYKGEDINYAKAVQLASVSYKTLYARINYAGWSVERAIETAINK